MTTSSRAEVAPSLVLRGVEVVGGAPCDLRLAGGLIVETAAQLESNGARVVDCRGLVALPGLVDIHTHLRQPGREDAETIATGSAAAARGGYVAVCAMANTTPVADSAAVVERVLGLGREAGLCHVRPVGSVSVGLRGRELADIAGMAASSARVRMFSDDGMCVADAFLMREALRAVRAVGGVVAQHAQEPSLTVGAQMNEGALAVQLGLPGWPAVAEEVIIARDCLLAHHEGARLHVCHVSTAGSVGVIRWAKQQGWPVTAEVTPHHLLLTEEQVRSGDANYKVNPPLRTAADVEALRGALVDGTIDAVATDHAPHPPHEKALGWCDAPMGMLGLETALAVVAETLVRPGLLAWGDIADRMSARPAAIAALGPDYGRPLKPGAPATLCLVDPAANWTVDGLRMASRSRNTPVDGVRFSHRVVATVWNGKITHDLVGLA
jgi:dihydroorotase